MRSGVPERRGISAGRLESSSSSTPLRSPLWLTGLDRDASLPGARSGTAPRRDVPATCALTRPACLRWRRGKAAACIIRRRRLLRRGRPAPAHRRRRTRRSSPRRAALRPKVWTRDVAVWNRKRSLRSRRQTRKAATPTRFGSASAAPNRDFASTIGASGESKSARQLVRQCCRTLHRGTAEQRATHHLDRASRVWENGREGRPLPTIRRRDARLPCRAGVSYLSCLPASTSGSSPASCLCRGSPGTARPR